MLIYLLLINATGFLVMLYDKFLARNNLHRIPEKTLLGIAIFGGSIGCLLGMYTVRHKTRHKSFTVGIPIILFIHIILTIVYLKLKQQIPL